MCRKKKRRVFVRDFWQKLTIFQIEISQVIKKFEGWKLDQKNRNIQLFNLSTTCFFRLCKWKWLNTQHHLVVKVDTSYELSPSELRSFDVLSLSSLLSRCVGALRRRASQRQRHHVLECGELARANPRHDFRYGSRFWCPACVFYFEASFIFCGVGDSRESTVFFDFAVFWFHGRVPK